MKELSSAVSPFAMLDSREQMEQWIWWHCQKQDEHKPGELKETDCLLPDTAQKRGEAVPASKNDARASVMPPPRHGQYDAVMKRMNSASRQTKAYIPWTDSL